MLLTMWVLATAQARAKAAAARVRSRDSQPRSGRGLLMARSCGVLARMVQVPHVFGLVRAHADTQRE